MLPICKIEIQAFKPVHKDYPSSLTTLADHIKARRMNLKLSKAELANFLQINPMTISLWENSDRKPVPRMVKKIINFLGYVPPLGVDNLTLAGQLYTYRCIYGLKQKDIALQLKMDGSAIIKIENNNKVEKKYKRKIQTLLNL
jgi:transcriptional regulator with XRE-family HTH domain